MCMLLYVVASFLGRPRQSSLLDDYLLTAFLHVMTLNCSSAFVQGMSPEEINEYTERNGVPTQYQ